MIDFKIDTDNSVSLSYIFSIITLELHKNDGAKTAQELLSFLQEKTIYISSSVLEDLLNIGINTRIFSCTDSLKILLGPLSKTYLISQNLLYND